jgi:N-acetylglucosamine kinase-like BadF-type ATPase
MELVLGFDGGGTKTECVLMDGARKILARSRSGPSNPLRVGFGGALAAICEAARTAIQSAQVSSDEIGGICAGLAGTGQAEAGSKIERLLGEEFPTKRIRVCTDLELTLEAAGDGPAIVMIAGTGSAAIGRDTEGCIVRVGGHGPLLGDEGSAYEIGRLAAIAALREYERTGADSNLGASILRQFGLADWPEFQLRAYATPDGLFLKIFPLVASAAEAGDTQARALLQHAAADLAALVGDLLERLQLKNHRVLLVKSGGMVGHSVYFDQKIAERLLENAPLAECGALVMTPAEAAARLALRLLSQPTEKGFSLG